MLPLIYPLLQIDLGEVEFGRRGFTCSRPAVRERLEHVGRTFLYGYHAGLKQDDAEELTGQLDEIAAEHRGFAYEGAGMALALLDGIGFRRRWRRFSRLITGPGQRHTYMLHVGAGWACARLPWLRKRIESAIHGFHPVFGWLAIDGYGFHQGFFHWQTPNKRKLSGLSEDARHVFHQGLGRSLWFIHGAEVGAIAQTILSFAPQFQSDAWSGVGLGCAYAGGLNRAELEELLWHAGSHREALAQGAAFAAKARQLAGNPTGHTEAVCKVLSGLSTEHASMLCDQTLEETRSSALCPYQSWRKLLHERLRVTENTLQDREERLASA